MKIRTDKKRVRILVSEKWYNNVRAYKRISYGNVEAELKSRVANYRVSNGYDLDR